MVGIVEALSRGGEGAGSGGDGRGGREARRGGGAGGDKIQELKAGGIR